MVGYQGRKGRDGTGRDGTGWGREVRKGREGRKEGTVPKISPPGGK
jgi:hypothetical protein